MACFLHALGYGFAHGHQGKRALVGALILLATAAVPESTSAANPSAGTGDRATRSVALRAIPWQEIRAKDRQLVKHVVSKPTLYRRMPTRVVDCDPDLYALLIEHPELVVDVWGVMGISKLQLERTAPKQYRMTDCTGTVGKVRVLYNEGQLDGAGDTTSFLIAHAQGVYEAPPMPRPIRAECVMLLHSEATHEANGRTYITSRLDSFVRFDRPATELIAKVLTPLVSKTADHNFTETMRFVSLFSRTAEQNPMGMQRLASNLTKIDEATRQQLVAVCHETSLRSAERRQRRAVSMVSATQSTEPTRK